MAVRSYSAQKAALTRAVKTGDKAKVRAEVERAVAEWDSGEAPYYRGWPDDWSRWERALRDVSHWSEHIDIQRL